MTRYEIEQIRSQKWDEIDKLTTSLEKTAKSMSRQQKQHYMSLYKVSIYEKIRAFRYIQLSEEFDIHYFLNNFPSNLRDNLEFMEYALILHPELISHAGESIKDNYSLGLFIIKYDTKYLSQLSARLRNNKEIIRTAIKTRSCDFAFNFASNELKNDTEFVLELLDITDMIYPYVSDRLKDDEEVTYKACKSYVGNLEYASERLRTDKRFIEYLIRNNDYSFCGLSQIAPTEILNELAVELLSEDFKYIYILDSPQYDYICKYYTKEAMNELITYLKERCKNENSFEWYIIQGLNLRLNGSSRKKNND